MADRIKIIVMDVDGTLTDGKIYIGKKGEAFKAFNTKDGYALAAAEDYGLKTAIITGRKSDIVSFRAKELKINEVYQDISVKPDALKKITQKYGYKLSEVAYIGDDLNDLECIKLCGLTGCPNDSVEEIKKAVDFVCTKNGGDGAVREFIDYIRKFNVKN